MASTFELKQTPNHTFVFTYCNSKGDVLLTSPEFATKIDAERAIKEVRVGSMMSQMISVGVKEGAKYFEIKNQQGQMLVRSIGLTSDLAFNNMLHAVRENACIAEVNEA